jgi:hypothetical protein
MKITKGFPNGPRGFSPTATRSGLRGTLGGARSGPRPLKSDGAPVGFLQVPLVILSGYWIPSAGIGQRFGVCEIARVPFVNSSIFQMFQKERKEIEGVKRCPET